MRNKCLGVFLVLVTIPLVMLSILQLASSGLLSSQFYKNFFTKNNLYEKFVLILPQKDSSQDIIAAFSQSIDANWLKVNTEKNLDAFFAYLFNKTSTFDFNIDTSVLKTNPSSDIPEDLQKILPDTLTLETYGEFLTNTKDQFLKNSKELDQEIAQKDLQDINKQIEDFGTFKDKFSQNTKAIQTSFLYFKIGLWVIYGLTLLMLVVVGLAARRYWPAILRWIGQAIFIPALLLVMISFLLPKFFIDFYHPLQNLKVTTESKDFIMTTYNGLVNTASFNVSRVSLAFALVGLLLIILSYILPLILKTPPPAPPTPAPPKTTTDISKPIKNV